MKSLLLMRHAKSSWKDSKLKDMDRPLTKRGLKNAPRMGELLLEMDLVPQSILCSPAVRAKQTAELVSEALHFDGETYYLESLYMAEPPAYLEALAKLPDELERVLVIGHNPGLEALMQLLTDQCEALPTASVAYISLPITTWKHLKKKVSGDLVNLWRPRELE